MPPPRESSEPMNAQGLTRAGLQTRASWPPFISHIDIFTPRILCCPVFPATTTAVLTSGGKCRVTVTGISNVAGAGVPLRIMRLDKGRGLILVPEATLLLSVPVQAADKGRFRLRRASSTPPPGLSAPLAPRSRPGSAVRCSSTAVLRLLAPAQVLVAKPAGPPLRCDSAHLLAKVLATACTSAIAGCKGLRLDPASRRAVDTTFFCMFFVTDMRRKRIHIPGTKPNAST